MGRLSIFLHWSHSNQLNSCIGKYTIVPGMVYLPNLKTLHQTRSFTTRRALQRLHSLLRRGVSAETPVPPAETPSSTAMSWRRASVVPPAVRPRMVELPVVQHRQSFLEVPGVLRCKTLCCWCIYVRAPVIILYRALFNFCKGEFQLISCRSVYS